MADKKTTSAKKTPPKKPKDRGLGRGLSALMADVAPATTPPAEDKTSKPRQARDMVPTNAVQGVEIIAIDRLDRNPDQPRKHFDKTKLAELTQSIRDKGVLQPILVRPIGKSGSRQSYQIVAGERRWQAALKAGLGTMPVLIRELSDQAVLEIGVVENVQRADLNAIEEAQAYQALITDFGRTQKDVAVAVGKSRPHVANMLRLLTLPNQAQRHLQTGKITTGHARAIISAPDPVELSNYIADKNLSVREAEDWVRRIKAASDSDATPKARKYKDPDVIKAEQDLADILGLLVDLRHKGPGGELRIKYRTGDQLEDVIKRLSK